MQRRCFTLSTFCISKETCRDGFVAFQLVRPRSPAELKKRHVNCLHRNLIFAPDDICKVTRYPRKKFAIDLKTLMGSSFSRTTHVSCYLGCQVKMTSNVSLAFAASCHFAERSGTTVATADLVLGLGRFLRLDYFHPVGVKPMAILNSF